MLSRYRPSPRGLLAALAVTLILSLGLVAIVGSGDSRDARIVPPEPGAMHPVSVEIQSLRDNQAERLRDLNARALSTEDPADELEIQREIQRVKLDTEIALYEAQLRHAVERGDEATAEKLRGVLEAYANLGRRRGAEDVSVPARGPEGEEVAP